MFLLNESEIIKLAKEKSGLNQSDFSKLIGKSQGQLSKYLSGASRPTHTIIIRCVNILESSVEEDGSLLNLMIEISKLDGEKNIDIRKALLATIKAFNSSH